MLSPAAVVQLSGVTRVTRLLRGYYVAELFLHVSD